MDSKNLEEDFLREKKNFKVDLNYFIRDVAIPKIYHAKQMYSELVDFVYDYYKLENNSEIDDDDDDDKDYKDRLIFSIMILLHNIKKDYLESFCYLLYYYLDKCKNISKETKQDLEIMNKKQVINLIKENEIELPFSLDFVLDIFSKSFLEYYDFYHIENNHVTKERIEKEFCYLQQYMFVIENFVMTKYLDEVLIYIHKYI